MKPNIQLRKWKEDDLESLVRYGNNFNIARQLRNRFPHPYTVEDGKSFIKRNIESKTPSSLAITLDDEAIGNISVEVKSDIYVKNGEIGYWIGEPFWGQGILSQAIPPMIKYAFESFDIIRIYATVSHINKASQKVLKKSGFVLEGRFDKTLFKLGEYHDELIFAIRRQPASLNKG